MDNEKCIYCGSKDIEKGVKFVRAHSDAHYTVGPVYGKKDALLGMQQCEPVYADICKSCGSLRLWVWETDREWVK
ncbi:Hypothetical protein LUCI_2980 [Lucifera butyrica]|uniref:Uncharacterized protein n=1 Tax=Lucifera butyrica TaxID=1351585 RepID=A0A498R9P6_9FIRM|nr:hypothetical protein [Lucifera butyrica]VBB07715.1 Hypothetical protein LUCI_2980 [Lucifera butyrica]